MNIWVSLLPAVLVSIVTAFMLHAKGHDRSTFNADTNSIELTVPKGRLTSMQVTACCLPLLLLIRPKNPEPNSIWVIVALMLTGSFALLLLAAIVGRPVVVSGSGVEVVGIRGWRVRWSEVASIAAPAPGADILAFVSKTGRKMKVDGTFNGWVDLMRELPRLTKGDEVLEPMVSAAIRDINRWRTANERY